MSSSIRTPAMLVLVGLFAVLCLMASPAHAADALSTNATGPAPVACPAHCACFVVTAHRQHYNHAECTALDGLAVHPKTAAIHTVDISHLSIERLGHQLDKFTNLTHIVLSHNRLAEVPASLGRARRLRGLYLDHNRITSAKLHGIPETVQHLNLSHNHLTWVPVAELHRLQQLHTIALAGNPINCTCETLQARNWLSERHVSVDDVRCASPAAVKGMSWQLLSAEDVCGAENDVNIWNDDLDNELMLNDGAVMVSRDDEARDEDFDRDFIPIARKLAKRHLDTSDAEVADVDGSGHAEQSGESPVDAESLGRLAKIAQSNSDSYGENYDDDGGSGSGDDALPIPAIVVATTEETTVEAETDAPATTVTEDDPNSGVTHIDLHIFKVDDEPADPTTVEPSTSTTESHVESVFIDKTAGRMVVDAHPHKISAQEKETAESTYIVLVMLAILLLGLIVFVAIRRKNRRRQFSTRNGDAENGNAKELVDMNRAHPGKPSGNGGQANGNGAGEVLPLIGARDKWDSRIQPAHGLSMPDQEELRRAQEPLLRRIEGESPLPNETPEPERPEAAPRTHAKRPNSRGSVADGETAPGTAAETNNNVQAAQPTSDADQNDHPTSGGDDDNEPQVFQPISPKPARYSPVYSPETGRVKIKMMETARPRTPMLVSRSRSNAGDIVSTPVRPAK